MATFRRPALMRSPGGALIRSPAGARDRVGVPTIYSRWVTAIKCLVGWPPFGDSATSAWVRYTTLTNTGGVVIPPEPTPWDGTHTIATPFGGQSGPAAPATPFLYEFGGTVLSDTSMSVAAGSDTETETLSDARDPYFEQTQLLATGFGMDALGTDPVTTDGANQLMGFNEAYASDYLFSYASLPTGNSATGPWDGATLSVPNPTLQYAVQNLYGWGGDFGGKAGLINDAGWTVGCPQPPYSNMYLTPTVLLVYTRVQWSPAAPVSYFYGEAAAGCSLDGVTPALVTTLRVSDLRVAVPGVWYEVPAPTQATPSASWPRISDLTAVFFGMFVGDFAAVHPDWTIITGL